MQHPNSSLSKHIVLWGGWYGSHNVGDQVLLLTITDILAQTLNDVRFTVLTNDPGHVNAYTQRDSTCRIKAVHNRRQFHRVVHTLATCDLFIFGGAVPFYEERSHVLAMATLIGLCKTFRTPYMTWSVSSQIVTDNFAKQVFRWVLNGAKVITYRDENTRALFESCGVNKPMHLTADSGFWLEPAEEKFAEELLHRSGLRDYCRPLVAFTPRTLRGREKEAQTHYNEKTPQQFEREIDCFATALDWSWKKGYQPVFIPMNSVPPDDDRIASRLVIEHAKYGDKALLIDEEVWPRIAPALYRRCHFSFVARVHGSITSAVGKCPVMMYAFAPKHAGIMKSMGLERYTLLESDATPARTIEIITNIETRRESLRTTLHEQLEILRQEALVPARYVAQILPPNF